MLNGNEEELLRALGRGVVRLACKIQAYVLISARSGGQLLPASLAFTEHQQSTVTPVYRNMHIPSDLAPEVASCSWRVRSRAGGSGREVLAV